MNIDLSSFYSVVAGAAATLIGLLFVAISIVPQLMNAKHEERVGVEVQASGCMLCFINVLVIALVSLASPTSMGGTALALSIIGLAYGLASLRSLSRLKRNNGTFNYSQLGFMVILLLLFAVQLYSALNIAIHHVSPTHAMHDLSAIVIVTIVLGVVRTWQLVGLRDTGLLSSLSVIFRRDA